MQVEYDSNLSATLFQIWPWKLLFEEIKLIKLSISLFDWVALILSASKFSWRGPIKEEPPYIASMSDIHIFPELPSTWEPVLNKNLSKEMVLWFKSNVEYLQEKSE